MVMCAAGAGEVKDFKDHRPPHYCGVSGWAGNGPKYRENREGLPLPEARSAGPSLPRYGLNLVLACRAESSANDLRTGQGVVRGRAASSLRSTETSPYKAGGFVTPPDGKTSKSKVGEEEKNARRTLLLFLLRMRKRPCHCQKAV